MKFLKQADFSVETDQKERLRKMLFSGQTIPFPNRQLLDDDDAALVSAAGDPSMAHNHRVGTEKDFQQSADRS